MFSLSFLPSISVKSFCLFTAVCGKFVFSIHNMASFFHSETTSFGVLDVKYRP